MIKIKQTICTKEDGNCLAACLASVLEHNLEDFPALPRNKEWVPTINNYLHTIGYNLVLIEGLCLETFDGYYLIIGLSDTSGHLHCAVGKNGKTVHDPSPLRDENSKPLQEPYYGVISKIIE